MTALCIMTFLMWVWSRAWVFKYFLIELESFKWLVTCLLKVCRVSNMFIWYLESIVRLICFLDILYLLRKLQPRTGQKMRVCAWCWNVLDISKLSVSDKLGIRILLNNLSFVPSTLEQIINYLNSLRSLICISCCYDSAFKF